MSAAARGALLFKMIDVPRHRSVDALGDMCARPNSSYLVKSDRLLRSDVLLTMPDYSVALLQPGDMHVPC